MPTQPNEGGRDLKRRASDVLNPEKRTETADHAATRRKVLSMVTGGIAATAAVGTAAASKRPTVSAKPGCGTIDFEYTGRGPMVAISVHGADSPSEPLAPGKSMSHPVPAGTYDVTAHPVHSRGKASIPVEGPPVPVSGCGVDVSLIDCNGWFFQVKIENPATNDACIPVEVISKRGTRVNRDPYAVGPGDHVTPILLTSHDEWIIHAHSLPTTGDCLDMSGDTIPINGEPSPLHLEDSDCAYLTEILG